MKKINSIHFGGKMILVGVLLGILIPFVIWLFTDTFSWLYTIPGAVVLVAFFILFAIEMRQDNGKTPHFQKHLKETMPFDPKAQLPVIRASICTGEKVAGFKDKKTGHFVEVMLIRNEEEKKRFMQIYGIEEITTEY